MTDAVFEAAVAQVLRDEGGTADDPRDPGGLTRFGFALRWNPDLTREQLLAMTADEAKARYFRRWWLPLGFARLGEASPSLAVRVFDAAVTMGPEDAFRCLQRALRAAGRPVSEDGRAGPVTAAAVKEADRDALLAALKSEIAAHYRVETERRRHEMPAPDADAFLNGWLARAYA